MKNTLFRAIQEKRRWSSQSNFGSIDAAIFSEDGKGRSAEALLWGTGYAAEKDYGQARFVAVWERPKGDQYGNGYLLFRDGPSILFVVVPIDVFEQIERDHKDLSFTEIVDQAEAIVKASSNVWELSKKNIHHYQSSGSVNQFQGSDSVEGDVSGWSNDELRASVAAYIEMQQKYQAGETFVKKHYYSTLAKQFGRTEKAFEYRMQNISYVLSLMGCGWLEGLKPAKNVGALVAAKIERYINELKERPETPIVAFEIQVREELNKNNVPRPVGSKAPTKTVVTTTQYERDPKVKAWVIQQVGNCCERCNGVAPFEDDVGLPFLELHHLRRLADGGSDTVSNAVLLCPNCHRELHYGANRLVLIEDMYRRINRLHKE